MNPCLNCELDLCIYNDNRKCTLKEISINGDGCCAQIILPNIPDKELTRYKEKTLISLKNN